MTTYDDWRPAVERLRRFVGGCTPEQLDLCGNLDVACRPSEPAIVVAARLRVAVDLQVCPTDRPMPPTMFQSELLGELVEESGVNFRVTPETKEEALAWLRFFRFRTRITALRDLRPTCGDIMHGRFPAPVEVASIGDEGTVYFKGGRGLRAWPDTLVVALRAVDAHSESSLVVEARNFASDRRLSVEWSAAKYLDLQEYLVDGRLWSTHPQALLAEFEETLEAAVDERPLQAFLEHYPEALAALLGAGLCYVVPRPDLGGQYEPDFLLAQVDSDGPHWTYVELESPTAALFHKDGKAFAAKARRGIAQVEEWRTWIKENRDKARRSKGEGGYGFAGIEPEDAGLVIVGRRTSLVPAGTRLRRQVRERQHIVVRTYDGFLESLGGAIAGGPAASNPALLRNMFED